ncbi:hypothetical protein CROQUDRAFT_588873 [Cronartium quercuum f. sp. fusiforme G11]|uniref:Uncharacterized protein n=1 Tax=Cronartium quercuum f. sp. fusiforme G11 TaxID=708437 RepID=A0A9P6TAD1_9BASI|nr:hypothetical protein CROQUDRAFT_588873 [Cronartium quercuum f. sp. fusiforme G11]
MNERKLLVIVITKARWILLQQQLADTLSLLDQRIDHHRITFLSLALIHYPPFPLDLHLILLVFFCLYMHFLASLNPLPYNQLVSFFKNKMACTGIIIL